MSQTTQTRENHARFDPFFHFFLAPVTFILFVWSLVHLTREATSGSALLSAAILIVFLLIFKVRIYSLKVQDRVIRLEERLRLGTLGSESLRGRLHLLTEGQLIALRFASDAEAPSLAAKALDEKLAPKQIKASIQNWRGDYFRI